MTLWSRLFAVFAVLCAVARLVARRRQRPTRRGQTPQPARRRSDYACSGLRLSATGSVLLLAVTNHLTQNVAAMPLLWLAPLTLYLLTFIVAFEGAELVPAEVLLERCVLGRGSAAWPGCWSTRDCQFDLRDAARGVPAGAVRRLHVLPRRALPLAAARRAT